jgi:hypothetical protein
VVNTANGSRVPAAQVTQPQQGESQAVVPRQNWLEKIRNTGKFKCATSGNDDVICYVCSLDDSAGKHIHLTHDQKRIWFDLLV